MQPFEHGTPAFERAVDIAALHAERLQAVGLILRRDRRGPYLQQRFARQLEELRCVLIGIDETILIDVEHDDRLRSVLDERAVARFALAQRLLVLPPFGDVADAQDEEMLVAEHGFADRHLGRERPAVMPLRFHQFGQHLDEGVVDALCERFERRRGGHQRGKECRDVATEHFDRRGREHASGGRVNALHAAAAIDREDRVFHVIEQRVQRSGRRDRARGIGVDVGVAVESKMRCRAVAGFGPG